MMRRLLFSALALIAGNTARGIVVQDYSVSTNPPLTGLNWNGVFNYNSSSAVAVDDYWILTAAHVADDASNSFTVGTTTYNWEDTVYHDTADLALVRVDQALPLNYDIYSGAYSTPEVTMVGFGTTGTVVNPSNYTIGGSGRNTQRWGSNRIDSELNFIGGTSKLNKGFRMNFNTGDTTYEAGAGVGDSGGGVFINDSGTWKLAGIMTDVSTSGSQDAVFAVDAQDYLSWINETIPEPGSILLLSGAGAAIAMVRRIFII